jgi:hypothetical protein
MRFMTALTFLSLLLLSAIPAEARLTRLDVESRETVAAGASFGDAGPYEKLTGTAHFEVDPLAEANATIFDLDKAPRNARGKVEFSADMVILKPVDMSRSRKLLFFEVNNRGRKIAFGRLHDTPADADMNNPSSARDFGNGFLMRRGYVVAWVGWGADIAPGDHRQTVQFPLAMLNGAPITERIFTEFGDRNFNGGTPFTLPLSGGSAFKSYPAVSTDKREAEAQLFEVPGDSPAVGAATVTQGTPVPAEDWSFAQCPDGPPGIPSASDVCVKGGFRNDRNYHLIYRATGSPVMGLGYATTRDFVSFLRHEDKDDAGQPNPVAGMKTVLCQGISSSAMYMRDFLYQGFNADEKQRRVCDGAHIHVAGVQKLYLNYRFAQPNPFTQQHRERYVPDTGFPRHYALRPDPAGGPADGLLRHPATDPKVIHSDTSNEYWQFRASLVLTDDAGTRDESESPLVRRYLLSSLQHGSFKGDAPHYGIGNRQCEQLSNSTHPGPLLRALTVALEEWVTDDRAPPAERIPRVKDGTLVKSSSLRLPHIPGVTFQGLYNATGEKDFGPRVRGNAGMADVMPPRITKILTVLVPQVDDVGNDLAGIRHPFVDAPVATLVGWNTRRPEFGGPDLCDLLGSTVALPKSAQDARLKQDPRPSLMDLHGSEAGYVQHVKEAADKLVSERLMLPEDAEGLVAEARSKGAFR